MPRHRALFLSFAVLAAAGAQAQAPRLGSGKLLLTGGVSTIDGAAGGGLTPWALTAGYGTRGEIGASAFATRVRTKDYALSTYGAAVAYDDRFELSLAHQDLDTGNNLVPVSPAFAGLHLKQDIIGAKIRVAGDAVLDSDTLMPQIAVGVLHKKAKPGVFGPALTTVLGAKESGTEVYVSATKLFLAQGILVNGTLRSTKANQNGLLGFGGAQGDSAKIQPEVSVAWLLRKNLAIGVEARAKPDNLNESALGTGALKEDDWYDLFVAWAPSKHFSLTLAYVDLGKIAPAVQPKRQTGAYLSAQVAF
jgi:Protein of unknown function (DUF3034)